MESVLVIDQQLFLVLNHLPHTAIGNGIAMALSGIGTAGAIWFLLGIILIFKEEKKDHWFFLPLFLAGGVSWVIVEKILKPLIARARPTEQMGAIIVGNGQNDFSFPSGHATIAWAMAVVLSTKEPRWKWFFYTLATLISFSRIYMGKHYPLDVIGGTLLGSVIGVFSLKLLPFLQKRVKLTDA